MTTLYIADDEETIVQFGALTRVYPHEGAETLWLEAGGQVARQPISVPDAGHLCYCGEEMVVSLRYCEKCGRFG